MQKGYWVISVNVNNADKFKEYLTRSKPAIELAGGNYLIRAGNKNQVEGPEYQRHVLIEFPSYNDAIRFYNSKEYQDIKKYRDGNVEFSLTIVEGI